MSLLGALSEPKPDERDVKPSSPVRVTGGGPYGRKALDDECLRVKQAKEGERNETLNLAAFAVGQLIAGGELAESEAVAALTQAAKQCKLGDSEIKKTLASGLGAGKKDPRTAPPLEKKSKGKNGSGSKSSPAEYDWIDTIEKADNDQESAPVRTASTIASVLEGWRNEGALIHESTGFPALDEHTGGGPVYGSRWYLAGAPDAGKTALLIQLGHHWAERGVTVGFLAVDEEPSDLVARFAQRKGWQRTDTETRDLRTLDAMSAALGALTIRFYDSSWTIETAAKDLRDAAGDGKAALLIDSVQTVSCEAERLAEREMSEVAAVTARTKAIRRCATYFRLIAVATSELGRAAYNSDEARRNVSTLAASKWSGSIEYSARVLLGVRSVAGEKDLIDLELAKNKHGPRDEHVYLKLDRSCQSLWQVEHEPEPEESKQGRKSDALKVQAENDAIIVAECLLERPGLGIRELRGMASARAGIGQGRVDSALAVLGDALIKATGTRGAKPMSLDVDALPEALRNRIEGSKS